MITLKNVSDSIFIIQGEEVLPKGKVEVEDAEGKRLLAIFPDQLEVSGTAPETPAETASGEAAPADMNVKQLRAELTSRGVKFENTVDKAGLIELLTKARAEAASAAAPAETPEEKAAREAAEAAGLLAPVGA